MDYTLNGPPPYAYSSVVKILRHEWWKAPVYERLLYIPVEHAPLRENDGSIPPLWELKYNHGVSARKVSAHYHWVVFYHLDNTRLCAVGALSGHVHATLGRRIVRYSKLVQKRTGHGQILEGVMPLLYVNPPVFNLSIDVIVNVVNARVEMMSHLHRHINGRRGMTIDIYRRWFQKIVETFTDKWSGVEDCVSHYICRILCSMDQKFFQTFLEVECALIEWRTRTLGPMQQLLVLYENELVPMLRTIQYPRDRILKGVIWEENKTAYHYQQPFECVPTIVSDGRAELRDGQVLFGSQHFYQWQQDRLHTQCVADVNKLRDQYLNNPRQYAEQMPAQLAMILPAFIERFRLDTQKWDQTHDVNNKTRTGPIGNLVEGIEELSQQHFPPCMQHLYKITETRHLRNTERMNFARFLFDVGWTVDEVTACWHRLFSKHAKFRGESLAQFQQGEYGKIIVGLKKFYDTYKMRSCTGIIRDAETRGFCPYTRDRAGVADIEDYVRGCRKECTKQLYQHDDGNIVLHPKSYYFVSRRLKSNITES